MAQADVAYERGPDHAAGYNVAPANRSPLYKPSVSQDSVVHLNDGKRELERCGHDRKKSEQGSPPVRFAAEYDASGEPEAWRDVLDGQYGRAVAL